MSTPVPYPIQTCIRIGGHRYMHPHHIVRLQADRNYIRVYEANGQAFLIAATLKVIEERLRPYGFLRVRQGDILNTRYIHSLGPNGRMLLNDVTHITLSRRQQGTLQDILPYLHSLVTQ
jgi:two-component system, LytTR family, response regulator